MIESTSGNGHVKVLPTLGDDFEENYYGYLVARTKDGKSGIVIANGNSSDGKMKFGKLYVIQELNPDYNPVFFSEIDRIPDDGTWEIVSWNE